MLKGSLLRDAIISGAVSIANNKREVDELNVYPVPDGDTGTNMSMTMSAALKQLELMDDNSTVSEVANTAASALLRGARGNSGVILSLLYRGMSKGLADRKEASCENLATALDLGVAAAYKAVMNPTEGTILTVARMAANKANSAAQSTNDIATFWQEVCEEAEDTLNKTPEMLPVLKKAGVVDAGGMGLLVIFKGMLKVFKGGAIEKSKVRETSKPVEVKNTAVGDIHVNITFSYCTEFIVIKNTDTKDPSGLRAYLETIGDCVVVVDDDEIIKVHVHTNHPGNAIEKGIEFGALINLKIENMRQQHEDEKKKNKQIKGNSHKFEYAKPEKDYGFVAVVAGSGIESMFMDMGVDCVVTGGQTMNPSTDDILNAIMGTPAKTVFVLPNNKNIIMAAEQAIKLADRKVCVLQTRTIPQGISALLAFDENSDVADNRTTMTKAFERVQTGQITFAARDSEYEGHMIKKGEVLGLENGKLAFTDKDVTKATLKICRRLLKSDSSYITLIYGSDVTDESAEATRKLIQAKIHDKAEVMLVNGGQPIYYYIISVE